MGKAPVHQEEEHQYLRTHKANEEDQVAKVFQEKDQVLLKKMLPEQMFMIRKLLLLVM